MQWRQTISTTAATAILTMALIYAGMPAQRSAAQVATPKPGAKPAPLPAKALNKPTDAATAELDWVRVGTSGKTIIFLFKAGGDESKAYVKQIATPPQITINGQGPIALNEPIYEKATTLYGAPVGLPYIVYPLFDRVLKPQDKITVSAPAHWAACNGGELAEMKDVAVENYAGQSLLPPPPAQYTMPVGFNLSPEPWGVIIFRANLMREHGWYEQTAPGKHGPPALGPNGLPTDISGQPIRHLRCPVDAAGDYTLLWDGKDKLELLGDHLKLTLDQCTGGADNKRVYTIGSNKAVSGLAVKFLGTDVRRLRVYPPGVKTDGSQYWHPEFLRMLRGARAIRFIHEFYVCNTNLTTFDQLRQDVQEVRLPDQVLTATLVKVEPYDNAARFFIDNRLCVKLTTAQPHLFKTGQGVTLACDAQVKFTTGRTVKLRQFGGGVYVLSPTQFAVCTYDQAVKATATIEAAQDVQGTATVTISPGDMWLSEMADLVNSQPGCDMWLNIPNLMEDDAVRQMFALIAARLDKDRKVHVEYSNEVWHWMWSGTSYCAGMSRLNEDKDPNIHGGLRQWYAKRAGQIHALAREAFRKAGRPESDIVGVLAAQMGPSGDLTYAQAAHLTFDEYAVAPYWSVEPRDNDPAVRQVTNKVDPDQLCDLADMAVQFDIGTNGWVDQVRLQLKKAGFTGKLVAYEGGPEEGFFPGMPAADAAKSSQSWSHHPRMAPWLRYFLQRLQDHEGMTLFTAFTLSQGYGGGGMGKPGIWIWPIYTRWNQPDGNGDGSDGLFNNLTNLVSPNCVSVIGSAYHDWLDHAAKHK